MNSKELRSSALGRWVQLLPGLAGCDRMQPDRLVHQENDAHAGRSPGQQRRPLPTPCLLHSSLLHLSLHLTPSLTHFSDCLLVTPLTHLLHLIERVLQHKVGVQLIHPA
jgi:hypothetical protein